MHAMISHSTTQCQTGSAQSSLICVLILSLCVGCQSRLETEPSALDDLDEGEGQAAVARALETQHPTEVLGQLNETLTPGKVIRCALHGTGKSSTGGPLFEAVPADTTGVRFVNQLNDAKIWEGDFRTTLNGSIGSGVCIGDIDLDGRPDIYLVSRERRNRLYRQVDDFQFESITEQAGVAGSKGLTAGASMADVDNDGDLDIFVCNIDAPNLLYLNQGGGRFEECAEERNVSFKGASVMASFCDYDRDGDLDMYLVTNRLFVSADEMNEAKRKFLSGKVELKDGVPVVPPEFEEYFYFLVRANPSGKPTATAVPAGQRDHLFQNDGEGNFTRVTEPAGLAGCYRGHCVTWWDYDHDGWPDLHVSNDFYDPDQLYHNNGDGTFTEVTREAMPHTPWFSMGTDFADVNNDGRFDLMATDMSATNHFKSKVNMGNMDSAGWFLTSAEPRQYMRNALFINSGTGRFFECAFMAGVQSSDWTWCTRFCDMDNDGWSDLFFSNGMIRNVMDSDLITLGAASGANQDQNVLGDLLHKSDPLLEKNLAFRNKGGLTFENMTDAWGVGLEGISTCAAFADLDRDGDADMIVNNYNEPITIYRNQGSGGRGLLLRLVGVDSNRYGLGAVVTAVSENLRQTKCMATSRGYMSSDEPLLHFGLGEDRELSELHIEWPSGRTQVLKDLPADYLYVVAEPSEAGAETMSNDPRPTMFEEVSEQVGIDFQHSEKAFDDFALQPLLPNKLSQLGPGMAWGDVDRDGDDDLFVGGAAGQPGALYMNEDEGSRFVRREGPWDADLECEDMGILWLDADSDGDLDLFVVSGGVEAGKDSKLLQDRLYRNDGTGDFRKATGALPKLRISGGTAAAADFDRDGDLDIFVGGRVVPGEYPTAPTSVLLRNNQGTFSDATETLAPELRQLGMITSAVWSDADADGYVDLLTTVEWGPVCLFHNDSGAGLSNRTADAGLAPYTGWWNGIAAGDLNHDGDIDYVVSNTGSNTKYHASAEKPAHLYYGVFDETQGPRIVEACYEGDHHYPVRGRSCSSAAMPVIAERFPTFRTFASAEISGIYLPAALSSAQRFEAAELRSMALISRGDGTFEPKYLPAMAQISPGFGVIVCDVDADGAQDVYLAQNFHSPQPETGHMDGGLSVLLKNTGSAELEAVEPTESGLIVPGDAMAVGLTDLNHDGRPDFLVANNNGKPLVFRHRGDDNNRGFAVRLEGLPGNPDAIGARIAVKQGDESMQATEIYAGSGYLSQSSALAFFARSNSSTETSVEVTWPNGVNTDHSVPPNSNYSVLSQPND